MSSELDRGACQPDRRHPWRVRSLSMSTGLVYRSAAGYELVMRLLYGRHYQARFEAVAELVPNGASVLDVCCGPAALYRRCLRAKSVVYTGLDVNPRYLRRLQSLGATAHRCDVGTASALPPADVVVMQSSLYHFLPDAAGVVDMLLAAAVQRVIVSEPVRNLADSEHRLVAWCAEKMTDPGDGPQRNRFTEQTLDTLFEQYESLITRSFLIPGGREKVYVLDV